MFMKNYKISFEEYVKLLGLKESFNFYYKEGLRMSKETVIGLYKLEIINK